MTQSSIDRPGAPGFSFADLACEVTQPGGGPAGCRLSGRSADDRMLLLDFTGGVVAPRPPSRLEAVRVLPDASHPARWRIESAQGRFEVDGARLFVHEDFSVRAATVIPPRPVPLAKRAFWRLVFALLATPFGRRWLERRASST